MRHLSPSLLLIRRSSHDSRKSKVRNFDPIITRNQQILAFDISMNTLGVSYIFKEYDEEGRAYIPSMEIGYSPSDVGSEGKP